MRIIFLTLFLTLNIPLVFAEKGPPKIALPDIENKYCWKKVELDCKICMDKSLYGTGDRYHFNNYVSRLASFDHKESGDSIEVTKYDLIILQSLFEHCGHVFEKTDYTQEDLNKCVDSWRIPIEIDEKNILISKKTIKDVFFRALTMLEQSDYGNNSAFYRLDQKYPGKSHSDHFKNLVKCAEGWYGGICNENIISKEHKFFELPELSAKELLGSVPFDQNETPKFINGKVLEPTDQDHGNFFYNITKNLSTVRSFDDPKQAEELEATKPSQIDVTTAVFKNFHTSILQLDILVGQTVYAVPVHIQACVKQKTQNQVHVTPFTGDLETKWTIGRSGAQNPIFPCGSVTITDVPNREPACSAIQSYNDKTAPLACANNFNKRCTNNGYADSETSLVLDCRQRSFDPEMRAGIKQSIPTFDLLMKCHFFN